MHVRKTIPYERYGRAISQEFELRRGLFAGRALVSIYFGGGTPSLWQPAVVAQLIEQIARFYACSPAHLEITLEANPDDLDLERLEQFRRAGINRISLGVQSLAPRSLALLGRLHQAEEVARAVAWIRQAGFENLSVDLMFALPDETGAQLKHDIDGIIDFAPDHVSAYQLTFEPRTAFGALAQRKIVHVPSDEIGAAQYQIVIDRLARAGYQQYEISSFAKPGKRAVHNRLYWTGGEYLGLGCSAHSFRRSGSTGERFSNLRSVDDYFRALHTQSSGDGRPVFEATYEQLEPESLAREALWLGLRQMEGVCRAQFAKNFGRDPVGWFAEVLRPLIAQNLLESTEENLRLTARGVFFADEIGARLV